MELLTTAQIAELLNIKPATTRARLAKLGIRPTEFHGATAMYDSSVVESVRNVRPAHRPPRP